MSWIQRVLYGVDLDEEQARNDALDAARAAENEKDRAKYGDEWFEETVANDERARVNVEAEVDLAFDEGLAEGADNVTRYVSKPFEIAGQGVGAVLKGLPAWLYIASAVALMVFLWPIIVPLLATRRR